MSDCCPECRTAANERRSGKAIDYYLDFACEGAAEEVVEVTKVCPHLFRGEKLSIDDGCGGRNTWVIIGIADHPVFRELGSWVFEPSLLGCGVKFPTCEAGREIKMVVRFKEPGSWRATFRGRAVVNDKEKSNV